MEDTDTHEKNLIVFNTFSKLIEELHQSFSDKHPNLNLYNRLIEKTAVVHKKAIERHISEITLYCKQNSDAISKQDHSLCVKSDITYSDNIFINMTDIFAEAEQEERDTIWKYFLIMSAYVNPTAKVKEYFEKKNNDPEYTYKNEDDFLKNMIHKVEGSVSDNQNPMEAVGSILSSGVFTDLVSDMNSGLKSGNLDLSKLMGSVQNLAKEAQSRDDIQPDPEAPDITKMMGQMTGMIEQLTQKGKN